MISKSSLRIVVQYFCAAATSRFAANAFDTDGDFDQADMSSAVFALDRGFMKKQFILDVVAKGATVLGTINNGNTGVPFKCVPILKDPPQDCPPGTIHIISEEGVRSAYWVKGTISRLPK